MANDEPGRERDEAGSYGEVRVGEQMRDAVVSVSASGVQDWATMYAAVPAEASEGAPVVVVRNLTKIYRLGGSLDVPALRGVSLTVRMGEFVAVMGPSGSGKSTFMNLVGCLDHPSGGDYWLAGRLVSRLSSDELAAVRNRMIGFVFQGFNLLSRSTALENVEQPMIYAGLSRRERERRARMMLQVVGLGRYEKHKPTELSGGEQQRVAVARALVNGPALLLADEPTGNLDSRTSVELLAVLQTLNDQGVTIVLVTHNPEVALYARRCVQFVDGQIVSDVPIVERKFAQAELAAIAASVTVEEFSS